MHLLVDSAVGIFINGMPMGNSDEFQLSSIPLDMVDEVEIYKGIIPAWLGGDGLGGAVNIRLKDFNKNHLETAFEVASYNTYIGSLQLKQYIGKTSTAFHAGATMNYAKNCTLSNKSAQLDLLLSLWF